MVTEDDSKDLTIQVENTFSQELLFHKTDLVILSIGAEPSTGTEELVKTFNLTRNKDTGFLETTEIDDITAVEKKNIFIIGNASGPKDSQHSLAQARSAAIQAANRVKEFR